MKKYNSAVRGDMSFWKILISLASQPSFRIACILLLSLSIISVQLIVPNNTVVRFTLMVDSTELILLRSLIHDTEVIRSVDLQVNLRSRDDLSGIEDLVARFRKKVNAQVLGSGRLELILRDADPAFIEKLVPVLVQTISKVFRERRANQNFDIEMVGPVLPRIDHNIWLRVFGVLVFVMIGFSALCSAFVLMPGVRVKGNVSEQRI